MALSTMKACDIQITVNDINAWKSNVEGSFNSQNPDGNVQHYKLHALELGKWLESQATIGAAMSPCIVYAPCSMLKVEQSKMPRTLADSRSLDHLVAYAQLPQSARHLLNESSQGVFKFTSRAKSPHEALTSIVINFKVDVEMLDSYMLVVTYTSTGLLRRCLLLAQPDFPGLEKQLEQMFADSQNLLSHPMVIPMLLSRLTVDFAGENLAKCDSIIAVLEIQTGQRYLGREESGQVNPLALDFTTVTRTLNTLGRSLGQCQRSVNAVILQLEKYQSCIAGIQKSLSPDALNHSDILNEQIENLHSRCEGLLLNLEFNATRVKNLLSAVYNFIAQKDNKINQDIASVARNDGSAMKAIALLTMCFLPGTFVATFFSMPVLDWSSSGNQVMKTGFRWFWAVTLPLTFVVLVVWIIWTRVSNKWNSERSENIIAKNIPARVAEEYELDSVHGSNSFSYGK